MCSYPANAQSSAVIVHRAVIGGLTPGSNLLYRVAGSAEASPAILARAPPPIGPDVPVVFLAAGDTGEDVHKHAKSPGAGACMARATAEREAAFFLHLGDLAYADGRPEYWEAFMSLIQPLAQRAPFMVAAGNHEVGWTSGAPGTRDAAGVAEPYRPSWGNYGNDSGGECGVPTAARFVAPALPTQGSVWTEGGAEGVEVGPRAVGYLPNPTLVQPPSSESGSPGAESRPSSPFSPGAESRLSSPFIPGASFTFVAANPPFWYSFATGSLHVSVLSSEHSLEPGSPQLAWLERDLSSADRCRTPWAALAVHRPLRTPYGSPNAEIGEHLAASLEPLVDHYQVDLVLSGHVHSYARSCPLSEGACRGQGAVHLTVGTGGRKLSKRRPEEVAWLRAAEQEWGYLRASLPSGKRMVLEFVGAETGQVLDSLEVVNERAGGRPCAANADVPAYDGRRHALLRAW